MLVKNENNELVELKKYADEILAEGLGDDVVSEEDAENALAELYLLQTQEQSKMFLMEDANFTGLTITSINKRGLWERLKSIFCSIVKEDSIIGNIVDVILEAVASVIPLGTFVKSLVKKLIKFFLQRGIAKVCTIG
ncbi:hypothetical protein [Chryseobacterium luquanense]|uniref:Uncharacterized protein n=1 Tax=Chryseobacterium luquanense TaxID=2983766 RepID=A0ABT3Y8S1_9FLAO|nr:hypothetical protein [Chryseobacterium luquanense]MCX8534581.1 hypothetical protein [Chryseobacterium luquanense]